MSSPRRVVSLLLAWALLVLGLVVLTPSAQLPNAAAAPGTPGVPQAPIQVYRATFDGTTNPQMLTERGFTADPWWRNATGCNGILLTGSFVGTSWTDPNGAGTCPFMDSLKLLTRALGGGSTVAGSGNNWAASSFTNGNGADNQVQVRTPPITVIPGGWYTASLRYATASCTAPVKPIYDFFLADTVSGTTTQIGTGINGCTAPGATIIDGLRVGTVQSQRSLKWSGGNQLNLVVSNQSGGGFGNDSAIDDVILVEATPQLDKQFVPATGAKLGQPAKLRFTITNTSELASKDGINFADALGPGLTVASPSGVSNTCGGTVTAVAGSTNISVANATLGTGVQSCVLDIDLATTTTGVFSNGPANVTGNLQAPGSATVTVSDPRATNNTATTSYDRNVTLAVLTDDTAGDPTYPLVPASLAFPTAGQPTGATVSADGLTLTVAGEGVYTVQPDRTISFDPAPAFRAGGAASPITYQVADSNGAVDTATATVTVGAAPTADAETATTPFDTNVTTNVLAGDTADAATSLDPTTVVFGSADQPTGATVSNGGKTLTVPGEGVYTVDPTTGAIGFDPDAAFQGTASPVTYTVSDRNGATASSTLTVDVGDAPKATADTANTPFDTTATVNVLGNDTADSATSLVPTSVIFTAADQPAGAVLSNGGKTLTVPGEGVYTINPTTGAVSFDPEAAFTGTAAPVTYQVADGNGATTASTLTMTVGVAPTATDDSVRTTAGDPITVPVLANDTTDPATSVDPTSVTFPTAGQPTGATVTDAGRTLTVPGEGVYSANPTTGAVTFIPEAGFDGDTSPVTYGVADRNGATTTAQLAVAVTAAPVANEDTASTTADTNVTVDVLGNDDVDPAVTIDPTSVVFPTAGQPTGATVTNGGRTLTVPGQGVYTANPTTGVVTFDPETTFAGVGAPVTYQMADSDGTTATASIRTAVGPRPTVVDDSVTTKQGDPVTVPVLTNDSTTDPSGVDATSVEFPAAGQPTGATVSNGGRTLTVPGQGVYTADPTTGAVTFTPADDFSGDADPVTYRVADGNGVTGTGQLQVGVTAAPVADDDTATTSSDSDVTVNVLDGDTSDPTKALDPTSVTFPTAGQPTGATVTDGGATLTVPGEGVYTADPTTGAVTFDPEPSFSGTATPVTYSVEDADGTPATGTLTVDVGDAPAAAPDTATTPSGKAVKVDVLDNDTADAATTLDATSVRFLDGTNTAVTTLTVDGQGTFTVDPTTGLVTFTPVAGFDGTATATYRVLDGNGAVATSSVAVTVAAGPTGQPDAVSGAQNTTLTITPLTNDTVGGTGSAIDPTTLTLINGSGDPVTTLVVPDEGTWTVSAAGELTFEPEPDFRGPATPVTYRATDGDGASYTSTVTATIAGVDPVAVADTVSTPSGTAATVTPLTNDTPGTGGPALDPSSLTLINSAGEVVTTLTVDGQGTFVLDPATGEVTFTPLRDFAGTATASYRVADGNGTTTTSTVAVTVAAAPTGVPDRQTTTQNVDVVISPLTNDTAGGLGTAIDPTTLTLLSPLGDPVTTLTVDGEGTWTLDPDTGAVTFDPLPGFRSETTPVAYRAADADGVRFGSTMTVTVAGVDPVAADDQALTPNGVPVTLTPLANDTPGTGGAPLDASTLILLDGTVPATTVTVDGQGTFVLDPATGLVTFTPDADFGGGEVRVPYRVADGNGTTATADLVVRVATKPSTTTGTQTSLQGDNVTFSPLDDFVPGDPGGAPADPGSVRLVDPTTGTPTTDDVVVPGEGTWSLDQDTKKISFSPEPGFSGPATPLDYTLTDTGGSIVTGTMTPSVTKVTPAPKPDAVRTVTGRTTTFDPLGNDTCVAVPATADACTGPRALVPSTLRLLDGNGDPVTTLTTDQGTWTVDQTTGKISFVPAEGFTGTAKIPYEVADGNGSTGTGEVSVTVSPPPVGKPDTGSADPGEPVTFTPLGNDPNADTGLVVDGSLRLVDPKTGKSVTRVDVPGEGVWKVDRATGKITFTPDEGFTGSTTPISYVAKITGGGSFGSTLTATISDVEVDVPLPPIQPPTQPPTPDPTPDPAPPGTLPSTGANALTAPLLGGGLLLLLLGGLMIVRTRIRRR